MAKRIKEISNLNSGGFKQLYQQFNAQFNLSQLPETFNSQMSLYESFLSSHSEDQMQKQLDRFVNANKPLPLHSLYDMKEEDEDVLSVSSGFDTVCDSDVNSVDFESIESSDESSGMLY